MPDIDLDYVATRRHDKGLPVIPPARLQEIAETHVLRDDPTFDMLLHLITRPTAD